MAKFGIQRTQRGITPASGAVRATFDLTTGEGAVGEALSGLAIAGGQAIKRRQERREAIEIKRQQMTDGNSAVEADRLRTLADEEFKQFRATNPQEAWEGFRQKQTTDVGTAIGQLNFSPNAMTRQQARSRLYSETETAKALTAATLQLREDTIFAQTSAMTNAFRSGTALEKAEAVTRFAELGANMGKDKIEVTADIKAAREAGLKLRNEDAVKDIGIQAVSAPEATLDRVLAEQEARKKDEGSISDLDLTDKDLVTAERVARFRIDEIKRNAQEGVNDAQEEEENRLFEGLSDGTMTIADVINNVIINVAAKRRLSSDENKFVQMDLQKSWPLVDNDTVVQDLNTKLTEQSSGLTDINEMNKSINDAAVSGKLTKATRDKMRASAKKGGLDAIDEQVNTSTLRVKNALIGRLTAREARFKVAELSRELTRDEQREARSVGFLTQVGFEQLNRFNAELNKRMRELGKETLSAVEVESLSAQVWDKYKKKDDAQKIREFMEFTGQKVPRPDDFPEKTWNSVSPATRANIVAGAANGMTVKQILDMIDK